VLLTITSSLRLSFKSSHPIFDKRPHHYSTADTNKSTTMADKPERTSSMKLAKQRLSGFLDRTASTASSSFNRTASFAINPLRRLRSNTIGGLPSRDAVPARSALRGGRLPGPSLDRRVSFYDSLPCPSFGPSLQSLVRPFCTESMERRVSLRLPITAHDDRGTGDDFKAVDYNKEQPDDSSKDPQPVTRQDISIEPVSLRRSRAMRRPRTGSGSISSYAERRRTCLNFTSVVMQERARTQSRMRSLSLLADQSAGDRPSRPIVQQPHKVPASPKTNPQPSSSTTQEQSSNAEDIDNVSNTYKAQVNQSLLSIQGSDQRRSAYLYESLVQMREALTQAKVETTDAKSPSSDDEEADRSRARAQALQRLSQAENSDESNDEMAEIFSLNTPYDSTQPSAESIQFITSTRQEAGVKVRDFAYANQSDEDYEAALTPLPLRIPPRHPGRKPGASRLPQSMSSRRLKTRHLMNSSG
jgi:hypothetical protein